MIYQNILMGKFLSVKVKRKKEKMDLKNLWKK